jgi:predicted dehydrogenase
MASLAAAAAAPPRGAPACRIGILGAANIARKNIDAMREARGVAPVAVASRALGTAEAYAAETGLDKAFGGYAALLEAEGIDAVYVPLPTQLHLEWVPKAAAAGKHVLCEKPTATSAQDLAAMLRPLKAQGLAFMDGVMFMHNRRLYDMIAELPTLGVGGPRHVSTSFSFRGDASFFSSNIRCSAHGDPLGCLGDLGWYSVRFSMAMFGWEMPARVRCVQHYAASNGVPLHCSGSMVWREDGTEAWGRVAGESEDGGGGGIGPQAPRTATFVSSFMHAEQQWARVSGSASHIECDDFVIPFEPSSGFECVKQAWGPKARRVQRVVTKASTTTLADPGQSQESLMWEEFASLTQEVNADQREHWYAIAMKTQVVIDALMTSLRNGGAEVEVGALPEIG